MSKVEQIKVCMLDDIINVAYLERMYLLVAIEGWNCMALARHQATVKGKTDFREETCLF